MFNEQGLAASLSQTPTPKEGDIIQQINILRDTVLRCQLNFKSLNARLNPVLKQSTGERVSKSPEKPSLSPLAQELDNINDILLSLEGFITYTESQVQF